MKEVREYKNQHWSYQQRRIKGTAMPWFVDIVQMFHSRINKLDNNLPKREWMQWWERKKKDNEC